MSTSYPFFKIAQVYGVDYGAVLSYANLMYKRFFVDLTCEVTYWEKRSFEFLSADVRNEVRLAMIQEHERQESIQKRSSQEAVRVTDITQEPKATGCTCDFSGGTRGMDRCAKCDGTGSRLFVAVDGKPFYFPNTRKGYMNAMKKLKEANK